MGPVVGRIRESISLSLGLKGDGTATQAGLEEDWELGLGHEDRFCISAFWVRGSLVTSMASPHVYPALPSRANNPQCSSAAPVQ